MVGLAWASLRHHRSLFVGAFAALVLGVTLIGVTATALASTAADALATGGPVVRVVTGSGVQVFARDAPDLGGVTSVLALGAVSGFITVVVVAGTFAFSVALRRRDLGLLRLLGASPRQIRRLVLGEAVAVAVLASTVGCVTTVLLAPLAVRGLNRTGLSPVPLHTRLSGGALLLALAAGVLIAVLGAMSAARRAARVRPAEALRDADLDTGVLGRGRLAVAGLLLTAGGVLTVLAPGSGAEAAAPLSIFGPLALTAAVTLLGPAYLPLLVRLPGLLLRPATGAPGELAVAAVRTARRRTAALAAPVLALTAVVGIVLSVMQTTGAAAAADGLDRTRAQLVVAPAAPSTGLTPDAVQAVRETPGVRAVSAPADVRLVSVTGSGPAQHAEMVDAVAVDLPALAQLHELRVTQGSLSALAVAEVAVNAEYARWHQLRAGDSLRLMLFDGKSANVTVRAVLDGGVALPQILLASALAGGKGQAPGRADVLVEPGADLGAVSRALQRSVGTAGVQIAPAGQSRDGSGAEQALLNRTVALLLAGPATIFALLATASAVLMGYSQRRGEVRSLSLLGARPVQIRTQAVLEAALISTVALTVANALVALALVVYRVGLQEAYTRVPLSVPWLPLAVVATLSTLVMTGVGLGAVYRQAASPNPTPRARTQPAAMALRP